MSVMGSILAHPGVLPQLSPFGRSARAYNYQPEPGSEITQGHTFQSVKVAVAHMLLNHQQC